MMQASLASEGVRRNALAMIAAGGPGLGPKAFNVRSTRTSCAGGFSGPTKGQIRTITGNLSERGTMTGSNVCEPRRGLSVQLIDGVLEERPGVNIPNEEPPVLDLDIIVENDFGRGVHINHKSMPVDRNSGQVHRIERGGRR